MLVEKVVVPGAGQMEGSKTKVVLVQDHTRPVVLVLGAEEDHAERERVLKWMLLSAARRWSTWMEGGAFDAVVLALDDDGDDEYTEPAGEEASGVLVRAAVEVVRCDPWL